MVDMIYFPVNPRTKLSKLRAKNSGESRTGRTAGMPLDKRQPAAQHILGIREFQSDQLAFSSAEITV
jgi:hypothetical protein